jgi:hypothetical protein
MGERILSELSVIPRKRERASPHRWDSKIPPTSSGPSLHQSTRVRGKGNKMGKLIHIQTFLRGGRSASRTVAEDFIDPYDVAHTNDLAEQ